LINNKLLVIIKSAYKQTYTMERGGDIIQSYEANSRVAYSELGRDFNKEWNNWGNALYKGRWASIYTDREMINDVFIKRIEGEFSKGKTLKMRILAGAMAFCYTRLLKSLKKTGSAALELILMHP